MVVKFQTTIHYNIGWKIYIDHVLDSGGW
jgi:hypothetical protein